MATQQHDDVGTTQTLRYQMDQLHDRWQEKYIFLILGWPLNTSPPRHQIQWVYLDFLYIWLGSFEDLWHEIQPLRGLINRCNVTKQDLNMSLQVNDLLTDKRIISYHIISVISSLLVYKLGFNKVRSAVRIIFTHTGCEKLKPVNETQKKHQRCHQ